MLSTQSLKYICATLSLILLVSIHIFFTKALPTDVVRTESGGVIGKKIQGVNAFLGIPYAAPPVGEMRWKPPHIAKKWATPLLTQTVPPHCTQSIFGFKRGQEDCLYLNIWTPNLKPSSPLPVMFWIHGGGFTVGHSVETTPGEILAKHGDVIVVSINYRLGAMGFMAHPELTKEKFGTSGNYGMLDQVNALQWVQRNIRNFGGDSTNITLIGESAGGMSVCNLLASPFGTGRFQKAIIQSGPCFTPYPDLAFMEKQGIEMEKQLGCGTATDKVACMRSKSASEVINAMPPDPGMAFGKSNEYWMPNIDQQVLKEQPFKTLADGNFKKVPVINGNNANEGSLIVMFGHEYQFKKLSAEEYPDKINYLIHDKEKVQKVLERYPLKNYSDPEEALTAVFSDQTFVCHEKWTSDALAKYAPVYSYYFSYPNAEFVLPKARKLGAFHSAEVQFLFGEPMAWLESTFSGDELKLSNNMMDYWVQFAKTGNPNGGGVDHIWPQYNDSKNNGAKMRLQLDTTLGEKSGHDTDETCAFWDEIESKGFVAQ